MHGLAQSRISRARVTPQCSSKGFGPAKPAKAAQQSKGMAKTAQQAADQALEAAARSAPKVRPINPREAAKGKVDYIQVKDWAKGEAADLGDLQVVPGSLAAAYEGAGGPAAAQGPFFAQLGRHAAYLESQGATKVARGPGNKPFVPFEQWQYSLPRYRQYVADLAAVHQALEEALQLALAATSQPAAAAAAHSDEPPQSSSSSSTQGSSLASAIAALSCFSCDCGIWRSQAAKADLQALAQLAAAQQQQQQQQASGPSPARSKDASVQASQTAVAYGKYLQQLGKAAGAAAGPQPPAVEEQDEACAAALKLLAHAYALHTQQQCLGTRIGAAATDALSLMSAGGAGVSRATAVYLDYPPHVREPLQQLVQATDAAGRLLGPEGRQAVMDELPRALTKATLVLAPLATA